MVCVLVRAFLFVAQNKGGHREFDMSPTCPQSSSSSSLRVQLHFLLYTQFSPPGLLNIVFIAMLYVHLMILAEICRLVLEE